MTAYKRDDGSGMATGRYEGKDGKPCYPLLQYSSPAEVVVCPLSTMRGGSVVLSNENVGQP